MFAKDQGMMTDLSFQMSVSPVNVVTSTLLVQLPILEMTSAIPDTTLEVERLTTAEDDFTIHESSSSFSLVKRTRDDNLLTPVEEDSSKQAHLS